MAELETPREFRRPTRLYFSWYNRKGREFDNGITWVRLVFHVRCPIQPGLWWSRKPRRFKVLLWN